MFEEDIISHPHCYHYILIIISFSVEIDLFHFHMCSIILTMDFVHISFTNFNVHLNRYTQFYLFDYFHLHMLYNVSFL